VSACGECTAQTSIPNCEDCTLTGATQCTDMGTCGPPPPPDGDARRDDQLDAFLRELRAAREGSPTR
jgi:hypothetical protein